MNLTRRNALKIGAGSAVACALGTLPSGLRAAAAEAKIPIGLQLYSVRKLCEQNLPRVLAAVAKMGYQGVEFAGYYDYEAKDLKKLLDDNGLACCGTHLRSKLAKIAEGDYAEFDAEVEFNQVLGNPYLLFPSMPEKMRDTAEACKSTAEVLTKLADRVKGVGAYVGYHAHGGDFAKIGQSTQWDELFSHAGDGVIMQMDVGNCLGGGGNPYATLRRYPGRSLTVHLKEHGGEDNAAVGDGEVDWKRVFRICESVGGTKWYIVEHERGDDPLRGVATCLENLRAMGK